MKVYLDPDFKCHVDPAEDRREFELGFFDGKCDAFIEGYRYVPEGEKWIMPNGVFYCGEIICPWKDYEALAAAQAAYEQGKATGGGAEELINAAATAYAEGVNSAYE